MEALFFTAIALTRIEGSGPAAVSEILPTLSCLKLEWVRGLTNRITPPHTFDYQTGGKRHYQPHEVGEKA